MARTTMKTKGSHGGHGFSLIDNTERRNDDDDQMMNQARTGNRNMDMATDMEVVRAATVETLAVGPMVKTVVEVVSKMDVVAMVATVDMVALVATKVVAKMDMVSVGATEEVATVDMVAVVATDEVARVDMAVVVASKVTRQTGNFLT